MKLKSNPEYESKIKLWEQFPQKKQLENKNFSPTSITKQCFQCQKGKVIIKWNKPKKKYSEKNNLGYYTEREEDKQKFLCDKCIYRLYYQNKSTYWKLVPNLKKRQVMRSYIYLKSLNSSLKNLETKV